MEVPLDGAVPGGPAKRSPAPQCAERLDLTSIDEVLHPHGRRPDGLRRGGVELERGDLHRVVVAQRLGSGGTHRPGADAEYVVVPAENATVVPDGIDPGMAAALAGVGPVAMNQFLQVCGIRPGMNVIVQGATSGIGSTAAMLARHLGATVVVSSRDESKRDRLRALGFEHVFDATAGDFAERAREAFGDRGADVVVDNLGAPAVWEHGFAALDPLGAIVSSGAFLGHTVPIDLQRLYTRGNRIVGVQTGTLESAAAMWDEVRIGFRPVFDRAFTFDDAADAHRYVERSANVGRVVLVPT